LKLRKKMDNSVTVWLQYDELLFYAACVSHCWSVCLCVCVCLEGRVFRRRVGSGGMRLGSSWRWQLSRAMKLAMRWCRPCRLQKGGWVGGSKGLIGHRLSKLWMYIKLLLRSLYYNSLTNSDTLLDCAFEPVYWIVDNVTHYFGVVNSLFQLIPLSITLLSCLFNFSFLLLCQVFVCLVVLLTSSVVIIVYLFVLPTIFTTYPMHWTAWHLCCGHWLLILVVFHYYKATTTTPGYPPKVLRKA
ncbi:hypothetical protein XENOCAPTIV_000147, partial [Xenoophorus captivus]